MKTLLRFALAVVATVGLAACNDDDNKNSGPSLDGTFQTFVTFVNSGDNGSVFTTTEPGTNVLTTFTSVKKFSTEGDAGLLPGTRVLIYYKNASGKRYESGAIDLRGVTKIFTGSTPLKTQSEISPLLVDMIDVQTLELSGTYINVVAQAACTTPAAFDVYFDEATVADEYPEAYVVFKSDSQAKQRVIMGSFDASAVVSRTSCKGIRVHYMTNSGRKTAAFPTGNQSIRPME